MADDAASAVAFGPNAWLVDDMFERYSKDPSSVAESWRDFFEGYRPTDPRRDGTTTPGLSGRERGQERAGNGEGVVAPAHPASAVREATVPSPRSDAAVAGSNVPPAEARPGEELERLRGAAARLAANMEASLSVPTATSTRVVPARLLEVNRKVLNGYLARTGGGKVSVTHLVGYAVVRAAHAVPAVKTSFVRDAGQPTAVHHSHVGLGLAVDVEKAGRTRGLLVPCVPDADTLDFRTFQVAYDDAIRKVRSGKLLADDTAGVTMTLTNPGVLGTVHSVPRLTPGQSVIVAVGALDYPAEFQGADPRVMAQLGISKVITLTSTYDHRVIQGAESALFLGRVHELLLGADNFYDEVFKSVGVPYEPVRWRLDSNPMAGDEANREKQVHVQTLINMYRVRGHLIADLDPLRRKEPHTHPELDPSTYDLTIWDLEREYFTDGLAGRDEMTLGDLLGVLRDAYCRRIGVEYMHIQEPDQKRWIQEHTEGVSTELTGEEQLHILDRLNASEAFERFLHTKYVGHKRFGLEGAESAIPLIDELIDQASREGLEEVVMGMAHRGRLNVLANIVGKSLRQIFREFEGDIDPESVQGSGDVKYHVGAAGKFVGRTGRAIPVTLASNPSHLEAVDPVVEGMVRAKQDLIDDPGAFSVLPLVIHGDAAFSGQGVVAETLNLSALPGYRVGGTIHLVVNNQVGFTTAPAEGRSSVYPTDVAKMVQAPIFHVNGDDPEACFRVARLAFGFRQTFHKDVVIDLVCYRLHGHNEGDDPSYTHPLMYSDIERRRSVRKLYTETLVRRGDITLADAEKALNDFMARMQAAFEETRQASTPSSPVRRSVPAVPEPLPPVETNVDPAVLDRVVQVIHTPPPDFTVHPKLVGQMAARSRVYSEGQVDWSLAESLALGSLLLEGTDVRLAGQDSRRGTFSQRHAVLVDHQTGHEWAPLAALGPTQGKLWVYDSMLSEYAGLGFEYGYSVVHKDALVAWEAQFGDFANGAQVVIDQFLAAAEAKWGQTSGLVLLLPHGYEGQGPEHSSARIERFLTLCAGDNLCVTNPTSAAQYFHVLRRQVRRAVRRPLVLLSPKSLLRSRRARSSVQDLSHGSFHEVIDDPRFSPLDDTSLGPSGPSEREVLEPLGARRVILASGKVAYEAMAFRDERELSVPVVRIEQLYPWPESQVVDALARYEQAVEVVWLQEEPENMGPWPFVHSRLHRILREAFSLRHVSRPPAASPAGGSRTVHQAEQLEILERSFEGL